MLQNKKIIAIHGFKGAGKDTVAALIKMHLCNELHSFKYDLKDAEKNIGNDAWHSDIIQVDRFAAPIKSFISSFLGISEQSLNLPEVKTKPLPQGTWYTNDSNDPLTIRTLHTLIGDGMKEVFNPDIFARTLVDRLQQNSEAELTIVPDLRFQNELDVLRETGIAYIIAVTRPDVTAGAHLSEQGLTDNFDYYIRNDGSLEELSVKVRAMMEDCGLVKYKRN